MHNITFVRKLLLYTMLLCSFCAFNSYAQNDKYNRKNWRHWIDADKDCLNTRHEVLALQSLVKPQIKNCKVTAGLWWGAYTGQYYTDPRKLDIDHLVPLKAAYIAGAKMWNKDRKKRYANDLSNPYHLIAVSRSANRQKGAKGPEKWMPKNSAYACEYLKHWIDIKKKWQLSIMQSERNAIKRHEKTYNCDKGTFAIK